MVYSRNFIFYITLLKYVTITLIKEVNQEKPIDNVKSKLLVERMHSFVLKSIFH